MSQYIDTTRCTVSTHAQKTPEWLEERNGLITASRLGTISFLLSRKKKLEDSIKNDNPRYRNKNIDDLKDIEAKLIETAKKFCGYIPDIIPPEHMERVQYGLDNEDRLRDELSGVLGVPIYEVGLCKYIQYPFIGASPDGVMTNLEIIEIKTTEKPTPTHSYSDFSEIPISHLLQMQQNMGVLGAHQCHYYAYSRTSESTYHRIVPFMKERWDEIVEMDKYFYENYIKRVQREKSEEDRKRDEVQETISHSHTVSSTLSFASALKTK